MTTDSARLKRILSRARWAPSGDNQQPWRFEIISPDHVVIHGLYERNEMVYDLDGHSGLLALGALLETLAIAASAEGCSVSITRRPAAATDSVLLFDVRLIADVDRHPDPLADFIEKRVVQRRPMSRRPLTQEQKTTLSQVLLGGYRILWYEGLTERLRLGRFLFDCAKLRMNMPEAFVVHKRVIEWGATSSEDRIPARAVGVDPLTERFMRWAMANWDRMTLINKWAMGDLAPRVQLDFVPSARCSAHFALLAPSPPNDIGDHIAAGRNAQRFWLTATSLGLYLQPSMTPIIFSRYSRTGRQFSTWPPASALAAQIDSRLAGLLDGANPSCLVFMGRIGAGPAPVARSIRKPLERLLVSTH